MSDESNEPRLKIKITRAAKGTAKLRAEKGINLPDTKLNISALTPKDRKDLEFATEYGDLVSLSFVRRPEDVAELAQSLGIPVKSVFAMAWAISALVSAVAGVVVAVVNGVSAGLSVYGIKVFPAVILGGLDSIVGAVLGGIIIGLLENLAHFVDSEYLHWGNLYDIAPFYVLIIILMIKPYGLFGTKDIERV